MKDQHTIERVALLHPKIRQAAASAIDEAETNLNITLRIVQGYRTFEEQKAIYDQGRIKPGSIVTYAAPGSSYHNYGLAIDVAPLITQKGKDGKTQLALNWNFGFKNLVPFFEKHGFTWGGLFKHIDADHFENKLGYDWRQLLVMYNEKRFIPDSEYLQL